MMDNDPTNTPDEPDEPTLPDHVIEAARSSRSKCKSCRRSIDKGDLRLGIMVEGRFGPGYMWHHIKCAGRKQVEEVETAYATEAWKNAKVLPDLKDLPTLDSLRKLAEKAAKSKATKKPARKIPYAELAPSDRSKCKHSGETIPKGSVRIVLGKLATFGQQTRQSPFAVMPKYVAAALSEPDVVPERDVLEEALRANSELDEATLVAAIAEFDG